MDSESARQILRNKYLEGFDHFRSNLHNLVTEAPNYLHNFDQFVQTFVPQLSIKENGIGLDAKKSNGSAEIKYNPSKLLDLINMVIADLNLEAFADNLTDIGLGLALAQGTQTKLKSFASEIAIPELKEKYGSMIGTSGYEKLDPLRKGVIKLASTGRTDFQIAQAVESGSIDSPEGYASSYIAANGLSANEITVSAYYTYLRLTAEFLVEG